MPIQNPNDSGALGNQPPRRPGLPAKVARLLGLFGLLAGVAPGVCAEPVYTEYQVKALFLVNFSKYVSWPAEAFSDNAAAITVGVLGEDKFGEHLAKAVEGRTVSGRALAIRFVKNEEDLAACQILFVSASEKKRLVEILAKVKTRPVLTVGEIEEFLRQGGIINFIKKDGKVRLEIDLDAARRAGLQISSKLLAVADSVRGKP